MLNAQGFAPLIKLVVAAWLTLTGGEQSVGKLFAVVRQGAAVENGI